MIEQPDGSFTPSRRPPTVNGGRPRPDEPQIREPETPTEEGGGYVPPGRGDRDYEETDTATGTTIDGVNGSETDPSISTDISNLFGEYSDIFKDLINKLKEIFNLGPAIDGVTNDAYSGNVFQNYLSTIRDIAKNMEGAEGTNLSNALSQMMAYYMSSLSGLLQNQFNIQQWQIQQEYNSPVSQLKRLSEAGLNPLYAFGSNWSNTSDSLQSSQLGQASAPSMSGDPSKFERAMGITSSILGAGSSIASTALAGKQVAMQAAKLPGELAVQGKTIADLEASAGEKHANAALLRVKADHESQTAAFEHKLFPSQLRSAYNNLYLQEQTMELNDEQKESVRAQRAQIFHSMVLAAGNFLRENKLAAQDIEESKSRIQVNKANIKNSLESAQYIRSQRDFQEFSNKIAKQTGLPFGSRAIDILAVKAATEKDPLKQYNTLVDIFKLSSAMDHDKFGMGVSSFETGVNETINHFDDTLQFLEDFETFGWDAWDIYKSQWFQMDNVTKSIKDSIKTMNYGVGATSSW